MSTSGSSSERSDDVELLADGFAQLEVQETLETVRAAFGPVAVHRFGITLDRQIRPTVVVVSKTTETMGWLEHQDSGQMVASCLLAFSRFSSMFGLLDRSNVAVNVTDARSRCFTMKSHFEPEDYLRCVVPFAEANRSLAFGMTDPLFEAFRLKLVPKTLAKRYAGDSVMPHVSNSHVEELLALDGDGNEIALSGSGGVLWRIRHSSIRPILLLCNDDEHRTPVAISIPKTGAMATGPLQAMLRALEREVTRLGFTYFDFHFTPTEGAPDSYSFRVSMRVDAADLRKIVPAAFGGSFGGEPKRQYAFVGRCGRGGQGRGGAAAEARGGRSESSGGGVGSGGSVSEPRFGWPAGGGGVGGGWGRGGAAAGASGGQSGGSGGQ